MRVAGCELCERDGGHVVLRADDLRVLRVADAAFPAFYRVVWTAHAAEWSDVAPDGQQRMMAAVTAVEKTLRQLLQPTKINLASLGNQVPHLHWHVVARFEWDSHFPQPIWAAALRPVEPSPERRLLERLDRLDGAVAAAVRAVLGMPTGAASD